MEVTIKQNEMVFIPAYWWYSIRFNGVNSMLVSCKYFTYMSTVSVSPKLMLYYLQRLNTKSRIEKTTQGTPTQGIPTQGIPTQGTLTQGTPTQGAPTQGTLTQDMPIQGTLTQDMPTNNQDTNIVMSESLNTITG